MSSKFYSFYIFLLLSRPKANGQDGSSSRRGDSFDEILHGKCQNITVEMCKDVGYPQTIMPNIRGNKNQHEAEEDLRPYAGLVLSGCNPHIRLFVCSLYVPICTSMEEALPPCRSLCLLASSGCERVLEAHKQFDTFRCEKYGDTQPCIEKNQNGVGGGGEEPAATVVYRPPPAFNTPRELGYEVVLGPDAVVEDCGIPCNDSYLFLGVEKQNGVRFTLGFFACFCLLSSLVTTATFAADRERFVYPQRPFAYVSACHTIVCLVYVVGFLTRGSPACLEMRSASHPFSSIRVAAQGSRPGLCVASFCALYYFQMAGHLWWVGLNLALLASAYLKWSQEAIARNAKYLHGVVWLLPGIQLVVALFVARLDGDPVTGTCLPLEPKHAKLFVLSPLVFYTVLGAFCWMASLVSLGRVRATMMDEHGIGQSKLDRFMLKVGAFGMLYMIPTLVYLSCVFYEQSMRQNWLARWFFASCPDCHDGSPPAWLETIPPPQASFHLFKNLSLLSVGLSSGLWIWNRKICSSWGKVLETPRCC